MSPQRFHKDEKLCVVMATPSLTDDCVTVNPGVEAQTSGWSHLTQSTVVIIKQQLMTQ